MSLMDMTDGAFMAKAYSWAFSNPIRKIFYNVTMTGLSVFIALFIGTCAQPCSRCCPVSTPEWGATSPKRLSDSIPIQTP